MLSFQPDSCNQPCLTLASVFSCVCPTQILRGRQYSLHRLGLLIVESKVILYHPFIGLAKVLFSLSCQTVMTFKLRLVHTN